MLFVTFYNRTCSSRCLSVMWSETVGLRTRPVTDQNNRSCRSGVVLWNTVLLRPPS